MVIVGLGGLTKDILHELLVQHGKEKLLFFTEIENDPYLDYFKSNGLYTSVNPDDVTDHFKMVDNRFLICVGDNTQREKLVAKYQKLGGVPHYHFSATANVDFELCNISRVNTIIMNSAHISAGATIEDGVIISQFAYAGHHATMGRYSFLGAFSGVSNSNVGEFSFIGVQSALLPGQNIGKYVFVGAFSMVNKYLPDGSKAYGVPAKIALDITNKPKTGSKLLAKIERFFAI